MKWITLALTIALSTSAQADNIEGQAPDFTLSSNQGKNLRLSDYRGEVVLINFWASWCAPCRAEMPVLEDLQQRYKMLGFTVFGVNVDANKDEADDLLADISVSFPILYDSENQISALFDVDAMPTSILVDRDGNMRFLHRGYKDGYGDIYEEQIKALVRE